MILRSVVVKYPPLLVLEFAGNAGTHAAIGPGDKVQGGGSGGPLADVFRIRRFGSESLEANNSVRLISAWETVCSSSAE